VKVILLNSTPATIQTRPRVAEVTYIGRDTGGGRRLLKAHRQDGVVATLGGRRPEPSRELHRPGDMGAVRHAPPGYQSLTVDRAEGREPFRDLMQSIGEPVWKAGS
jgi:carbamoyl-phosphate synthase large subunit